MLHGWHGSRAGAGCCGGMPGVAGRQRQARPRPSPSRACALPARHLNARSTVHFFASADKAKRVLGWRPAHNFTKDVEQVGGSGWALVGGFREGGASCGTAP